MYHYSSRYCQAHSRRPLPTEFALFTSDQDRTQMSCCLRLSLSVHLRCSPHWKSLPLFFKNQRLISKFQSFLHPISLRRLQNFIGSQTVFLRSSFLTSHPFSLSHTQYAINIFVSMSILGKFQIAYCCSPLNFHVFELLLIYIFPNFSTN